MLVIWHKQLCVNNGVGAGLAQVAHPALGRLEVRRVDDKLLSLQVISGAGAHAKRVGAVRDLGEGVGTQDSVVGDLSYILAQATGPIRDKSAREHAR